MKMFKFKKINKKSLIGLVLSVIMLVTLVSGTIVSYAWEHPNTGGVFNATLYSDQDRTYSGSKPQNSVEIEGKNNDGSRSSRKIYFQIEYSNSAQESWKLDKEKLIAIGQYMPLMESTGRSNTWWRLTLENYGIGSGGTGYGWMW